MVKVSLIIPARNRKERLAVTLNNILKQTVMPDEIIVVDDGSEDGTVEFLKKNYASKLMVLSNKGKGPGAARNTGLEVATGKFIKFFDSDDLMTINTLQVQTALLDNTSRGFIYSPYFFAAEDQNGEWRQTDEAILNYYPFDEAKPLHYWMAVKNLFITIPGMLFKRELLQEAGPWRKDVSASEDWDYLWRLSMIEPSPLHTNQCAFLYRVHGHQTTEGHFSNTQRDKDKVRVLKDIYKRDIAGNPAISWRVRSAFENKFYQMDRVNGTTDASLHMELKEFRSISNKLVWQMIRLDQKIGRLRTKTNWQPCHGPLKSKDKFRDYLRQII